MEKVYRYLIKDMKIPVVSKNIAGLSKAIVIIPKKQCAEKLSISDAMKMAQKPEYEIARTLEETIDWVKNHRGAFLAGNLGII